MPGTDGFEVCRILKASPQTANIPVIFISATYNDLRTQNTQLQQHLASCCTKALRFCQSASEEGEVSRSDLAQEAHTQLAFIKAITLGY